MERGKRREPGPRFISFPFPSSPTRFLFHSPQPPYDTKRPLRRRQDDPARQPALELMRGRADRASERTKRKKKHGKYLKETTEETALPRFPFGSFVFSISTYPPCIILTQLTGKRLLPVRGNKSRFVFLFERKQNLQVSFQVCVTRSAVTCMENISLINGRNVQEIYFL